MFRKIEAVHSARRPVSVDIDGQQCDADEGEPLAAVILRTPPFISRNTPVTKATRAPFCMMGACFDCLVEVDGATSVRSCVTPVRDGMTVRRQLALPDALVGTDNE